MCGVAGIVRPTERDDVDEQAILRMVAAIRHRGPDGYGLLLDAGAGLASSRLAIFDIPGGWQPIEVAPGGRAIVYNGEVYNHVELRAELEAAGERFATTTDTEVVLRLIERDGLGALERLNGQFAFALWDRDVASADPGSGSLRGPSAALRDPRRRDPRLRLGGQGAVRLRGGDRRAGPGRDRRRIHALGAARRRGPRFAASASSSPGACWSGSAGGSSSGAAGGSRSSAPPATDDGDLEAAAARQRPPAPARRRPGGRIPLRRPRLEPDHRAGRRRRPTTSCAPSRSPSATRGTTRAAISSRSPRRSAPSTTCSRSARPRSPAPSARWSSTPRSPLIRTAPVPLFLLARDVRANGITVVATGEGADELFWGYDLYKEVALRELYKREPERAEELLGQLYSHLGPAATRGGPAFRRFLLETGADDEQLGSHMTRAEATGAIKRLYGAEVAEAVAADASLARLRDELPAGFDALEQPRARRVARAAHPARALPARGAGRPRGDGPRGRGPVPVPRPPRVRLRGGLPRAGEARRDARQGGAARDGRAAAAGRDRRARQAALPRPRGGAVLHDDAPAWVEEALGAAELGATGIWDPAKVEGLVRRCRAGRATGMREGMALIGVLSTQLWHRGFIGSPASSYARRDAPSRWCGSIAGSRLPAAGA